MFPNDPNWVPGLCPNCGCSSEDMMELGGKWQCPECGEVVRDDDLLTPAEFARTR